MSAATWEGCTPEELRGYWSLPRVDLYARVGSTNDLARAAAVAGAPSGMLVLAEEQLAGRGRGGRTWASPPGLGLYISVIARPRPEEIATYPLRIGVAVALALDPWTSTDPVRVKWPNDLLLHGRKIGGVLCEGSWEGDRLDHVVVGIGLNLLQRQEDFPEGVRGVAGALRESGIPLSRFDVATRVVASVRAIVLGLDEDEGWLDRVSQRDALRGNRVHVLEPESGNTVARGRAAGISPDGALLLRNAGGVLTVRSGTVRLAGRND